MASPELVLTFRVKYARMTKFVKQIADSISEPRRLRTAVGLWGVAGRV
jgi:hypothetical protein